MNWWVVGLVANTVIAAAYFAIVGAIVLPLVRSHQLRSNPLGAATAAIFFTCAVHHGVHAVHMLMPAFGVDQVQGSAMRVAWGWQLALWDVIGATVAVYYWSLRRNYGSLMQGAQLFEDMRKREQQALELNDNVLQGLVVAKMSLDLGKEDKARGRARHRDRQRQPHDHRPAGLRPAARLRGAAATHRRHHRAERDDRLRCDSPADTPGSSG